MSGKVTSMLRCCFTPGKSSSNPPPASAASPAEVISGIKPKEAPLAGYLLARSAMHKKVEGQDLKNLRAGNETVLQVSELLPLGRANVREDIAKAKDANLPLRMVASKKLRTSLAAKKPGFFERAPKNSLHRVAAAVGQYAQTGTCGIFAANTAPMHAAKLAAMKDKRAVVAQAELVNDDHAWVEMMPRGMGKDGNPILHGTDVIMDGWGDKNLAILREDGQYTSLDKDGLAPHIKHLDLLNYKSGPKALASVEKYKARIERSPELKSRFRMDFDRLVTSGVRVTERSLYDAESLFSADFTARASAALHKEPWHVQVAKDIQEAEKHVEGPKTSRVERKARNRAEQVKHASLAEIQAIGVARSLGSNIRGAKEEASGIIASAKEMFPHPENRLPA